MNELSSFSLWSLHPLCLTALQIALALGLDKLFAEVRRFHPLVGFGYLANALEKRANTASRWLQRNAKHCDDTSAKSPDHQAPHRSKTQLGSGILCWLLLVIPLPLALWLLPLPSPLAFTLEILVLYFALGQQSLKQHALQIYLPLQQQDLTTARQFTSFIVSRETADMSADDISRATTESVLENGHDAVIASLFYFAVGGAPLVLLHRLINTLDAMWGYKTSRFFSFGWCAARSDDVIGWPSACCTAVLYALQSKSLKQCLPLLRLGWQQSRLYKSKNGGFCMATGAAVLGFTLGGASRYHGQWQQSPQLGQGPKVQAEDINRSLHLVSTGCTLLCIVLALLGLTLTVVNGGS